jgi:hypothetical protein
MYAYGTAKSHFLDLFKDLVPNTNRLERFHSRRGTLVDPAHLMQPTLHYNPIMRRNGTPWTENYQNSIKMHRDVAVQSVPAATVGDDLNFLSGSYEYHPEPKGTNENKDLARASK